MVKARTLQKVTYTLLSDFAARTIVAFGPYLGLLPLLTELCMSP